MPADPSALSTRSSGMHVPAWLLVLFSMTSVQVGAALSVHYFPLIGTAGTAWLRLSAAALVFLAVARPRPRDLDRALIPTIIALGIASGVMTVAFQIAVDRIPLGTVVAIEFLGPLTVAVLRSPRRSDMIWPVIALAGVALMTEPWHGRLDAGGVIAAAVAGLGWGVYIVFTQHIGDRLSGMQGLAYTMPVAAMTAATMGVPQAIGNLTPAILLGVFGLALLLPVLPYALEMIALRRLTTTAFGTMMALEPAIGLIVGVVMLHQATGITQLIGVLLVVVAGVGAERRGHRETLPLPQVE